MEDLGQGNLGVEGGGVGVGYHGDLATLVHGMVLGKAS